MAYTDQATLAADETFRGRVRVALASAAVAIAGEAQDSRSDTEYGKRQGLAYDVIRAAFAGSWLEAFVWGVVQNTSVTGASSDNDIQFTVNSVWDDFAGVRVTD